MKINKSSRTMYHDKQCTIYRINHPTKSCEMAIGNETNENENKIEIKNVQLIKESLYLQFVLYIYMCRVSIQMRFISSSISISIHFSFSSLAFFVCLFFFSFSSLFLFCSLVVQPETH